MDHKDQHRHHHEHERAERKKEERESEKEWEKSVLPFHPAWLVVLGVVLVLVAVSIWTVVL
jgi:hypothetical protein